MLVLTEHCAKFTGCFNFFPLVSKAPLFPCKGNWSPIPMYPIMMTVLLLRQTFPCLVHGLGFLWDLDWTCVTFLSWLKHLLIRVSQKLFCVFIWTTDGVFCDDSKSTPNSCFVYFCVWEGFLYIGMSRQHQGPEERSLGSLQAGLHHPKPLLLLAWPTWRAPLTFSCRLVQHVPKDSCECSSIPNCKVT